MKLTFDDYWRFSEKDWKPYGLRGYENINENSELCGTYVNVSVYDYLKLIQERLFADFKLIHDFRLECLPFGEYPDCVILDFLNKKYFPEG